MKQKVKHSVLLGLATVCVVARVWLVEFTTGNDLGPAHDITETWNWLYLLAVGFLMPYLSKLGVDVSKEELDAKINELEEKQNDEA